MLAGEPASCQSNQRGKGRPAVIDRDKILAAARRIPAERLTMQAVATELGVDPTALNYHVGGRTGLMRLAAADRMKIAIDQGSLEQVDGDWREVLRTFAVTARNAVASVGALGQHLELGMSGLVPFLELVETAIGVLKSAGFDAETAGRAIGMISHNAVIAGRALDEGTSKSHEQMQRFFDEVAQRAGTDMPNIVELIERGHRRRGAQGQTQDEANEQFEFVLDITIAGLEAQLRRPKND